jgi:hemin uptake protein HemP
VSHFSDPPDSKSGEPSPAGSRTIPVADHKIDSRDLFTGTREVLIQHGGETYRLRLTGQNKLILTK